MSLHLNAALTLRAAARPIPDLGPGLDPVMEMIGDASVVLLGEATHGTSEFYALRAAITRRLIEEKGFGMVAVEGDWPDAYRVNRYVRGGGTDRDAEEALSGFERFPSWMWRNSEVLDLVGWLREHNDTIPEPRMRVGFYGLDLYSLYASMREVVDYLERQDPALARRARERYACFDFAGNDAQTYGRQALLGASPSCEAEVLGQLRDLRAYRGRLGEARGALWEDEHFYAEQNARLVRNAEQYYRAMFFGSIQSWNLRDRHMVETLRDLLEHARRQARPARTVVWAHNSHLGDARATEMGVRGEWNVGQLTRQWLGAQVRSVGFTTFDGSVTAASAWDGVPERKRVRPGLEGSYEAVLHAVGVERFALAMNDPAVRRVLVQPRLERAIGVVYRPDTERQSHYFLASLPDQFDAVIHVDHTRAVEPLERALVSAGEAPETYPSAL